MKKTGSAPGCPRAKKGGGRASPRPPPFWTIFGPKSKKGEKKGVQKSVAKKGVKLMRKACENDAKMEAKMEEIFKICEKGEKAENYLFYSKKRRFGGVKK